MLSLVVLLGLASAFGYLAPLGPDVGAVLGELFAPRGRLPEVSQADSVPSGYLLAQFPPWMGGQAPPDLALGGPDSPGVRDELSSGKLVDQRSSLEWSGTGTANQPLKLPRMNFSSIPG